MTTSIQSKILEYNKALELVLEKVSNSRIVNGEAIFDCPYCGGSHKMYLNTSKCVFNCFKDSCHASGNINRLLEHFGIEGRCEFKMNGTEDKANSTLFSFPELVDISTDEQSCNYLLSRGISATTASNNGVFFCPAKHSMAFTSIKNGGIVGIEYRTPNSKKQIYFEKGSSVSNLRHKESIKNYDRLYITEGSIDALTLLETGINNVVSIPNGASSDSWIEEEWDFLKKFKEIVLCYDNDEPGQKALDRIKKRLGFARLYSLELGEYNDINEAYMGNPRALKQLALNPHVLPLDSIIAWDEIALSNNPQEGVFSCGIDYIDEMFGGFRYNEVSLLVAPSGTGKSTVVANLVSGFIGQGQKIAIYSGELSNRGFKTWLYTMIAGNKHVKFIANKFRKKDQLPIIAKSVERRLDAQLADKCYLYDANSNDAYQILERFKELHDRYGVNIFMLDNLSILDMSKKGSGQWEAQEEFAKRMVEFTRNNDVALICVTHPTKESINTEPDFVDKKGKVKPLQKWSQTNVKGSSSFTNLAHNILFMSRAGDHEKAFIKQSFQMRGEKEGRDYGGVIDIVDSSLAILMYLVKNRANGYVYETKLFGYNSEERKIYSLFDADKDIHFVPTEDVVEETKKYDFSEEVQI